jgi:hypothetical protein
MIVAPSPKVLLDGVQPELASPLLSTAEKLYETLTAGTVPALGLTARGDSIEYGGHERVGGVASELVIVNKHDVERSALSVVEHSTTVTPRSVAYGLVTLHVGAILIPELSEAVGVGNVTEADVEVPEVGDTAM